MSSSAIEMKKTQVEDLKSKIESSASTVIVQYRGLTVEKMTELRNQLREENIEFKVIKNNISSRAYEMANFSELKEEFKGPTAVAISQEDVTAPARILNNFAKENPELVLVSGTLEKSISSKEEIMELATLPNKEGMLSMLLSVLEAPIRGLAQVTSQVAEQKPADGSEETKEEVKEETVEESTEEVKEETVEESTEETKEETVEESTEE